jgi:hypothetical protein
MRCPSRRHRFGPDGRVRARWATARRQTVMPTMDDATGPAGAR